MQTYMLDHVIGMKTLLDDTSPRAPEPASHGKNIAVSSSSLFNCQESGDFTSMCQNIDSWPRQRRSRHWLEPNGGVARPVNNFSPESTQEQTHRPQSSASSGVPLCDEPVHGAAGAQSTGGVSECSSDYAANRALETPFQQFSSSEGLVANLAANENYDDYGCNTDCMSVAKESTQLDRRSSISNDHFGRLLGAERLQRIANAVAAAFSPVQFGSSSRRRRSSSQAKQPNRCSRGRGQLFSENGWRGSVSTVGGRAAGGEEPSPHQARGAAESKRLGLSSRLTRAFGWNDRMHMLRLKFCSTEMEDSYKHNFYSNKAHINTIEQAIIIFLVSAGPECSVLSALSVGTDAPLASGLDVCRKCSGGIHVRINSVSNNGSPVASNLRGVSNPTHACLECQIFHCCRCALRLAATSLQTEGEHISEFLTPADSPSGLHTERGPDTEATVSQKTAYQLLML